MSEPLMEFMSHIEGRNAKVAIYDDRIEWGRQRFTMTGTRRDTNMVPVRQIQGVTTHRAGMLYTVVKVATSADVIEMRVSKAQAGQIKAILTRLMLGGVGAPPPPAPAAAPAASAPALVADELAKLVQLRDAGALTDEEFAAQKARLLGS
jgi:Short C-terminal domain